MQLDQYTAIESASLVANIPIRSSNDFKLGFALVVPSLKTAKQRDEIVHSLKQSIPFLQISPSWGDNYSVINCSVADVDKAGISKHALNMFEDAGLRVSAMGGASSARDVKPPYLNDSPEPENLPYSFNSFTAFKELLCGTVNAVLNGPKIATVAESNLQK